MEIRVLRAKANLSQKEMAERMGLTAQTIQKYESGERNIPATVQKLIRYEFAQFLPEKERLIAEPVVDYEQGKSQELKKCLEENNILQDQLKDLPHLKEQNHLLRRTVEILEEQIELYKERVNILTGNGNGKSA